MSGNRGFRRTNKTPGGYKNEPTGRVHMYDKIYVGFVKDNRDVIKMGRLKVWIPELSPGDPTDEARWYTVNYCTPFGGATRASLIKKDSTEPADTQQSYGFWAVPPDLDNEVIVMFINGDPNRGIWIGSLYQQFMNHMVPGLASDVAFDQNYKDGIKPPPGGINPPVKEYNKRTSEGASDTPHRPIFAPLHVGLFNEGLYVDGVRGPSSASGRRTDDYDPGAPLDKGIVAAENLSGADVPGTVDSTTNTTVNPLDNNGDTPADTPATDPAAVTPSRVAAPSGNPTGSPATTVQPASTQTGTAARTGTATTGAPNGSANPGSTNSSATAGSSNTSTAPVNRGDPPALVYGLISPKGNHMYIDDAQDGMIRIRTRNGAQIMINDNVGYIYMITRNGNSWMEISDDGIDMYSSKSISMRAHGDINMHADGNINQYAAGSINHVAQGGGTGTYTGGFNMQTDQLNLTSSGSVNIYSPKRVSISGPSVGIAATGDIGITAGGALGLTATGAVAITGAPVTENKGLGPQARVEPIPLKSLTSGAGGASGGSASGGSGSGSTSFSGPSGGATVSMPSPGSQGADHVKRAMDYFMGQGWTQAQAAGIVGNLMQESHPYLDPAAHNPSSNMYGLAQWDTSRRLKFQQVMGTSIYGSSLDQQLAFVQWELSNTYKSAASSLKTATTPSQAARIFQYKYEGAPGQNDGERAAYAENLGKGQYSADPGVKTQTPSSSGNDASNLTPGLQTSPTPPEPDNTGRYISGPIGAGTPTPDVLNDRMLDVDDQYPECATYTIVSRLVTHEPFNLHPKAPTDPVEGAIPSSLTVTPQGDGATTGNINGAVVTPSDGKKYCVPTSGKITSPFGATKGRNHVHQGIDIAGPVGTPVVAAKDGVLSFHQDRSPSGGYGLYATIQHADGMMTVYGHLSKQVASPGQVSQGTVIGLMGSSGHSTGPHLHFGISTGGVGGPFVNPANLIAPLSGGSVQAGAQ